MQDSEGREYLPYKTMELFWDRKIWTAHGQLLEGYYTTRIYGLPVRNLYLYLEILTLVTNWWKCKTSELVVKGLKPQIITG
jgi:hypothetical protein